MVRIAAFFGRTHLSGEPVTHELVAVAYAIKTKHAEALQTDLLPAMAVN